MRREPVVLPSWEPHTWGLSVWPSNDPASCLDVDCFPLPHCTSTAGGVEAPLVRLEDGPAGAHALTTVTLNQLPQTFMRDRAIDVHDPVGEFDTLMQTVPFGPQIQNVMEPAIEAGAMGFVGIFDAPWESCDYYVPYDALERPIPGVWVSRSDGARLTSMIERGPTLARITVDADRRPITTSNILGVLPGASDQWVIVGSHHDGPWVSAVEDASGVALVLAQARYWSRVPERERPHNMLFLVTSGHMAGGAGTNAFIDRHRGRLDDVVLEVHLEHTARECEGVDGELVPTDRPEIRWWFTTRDDALVDSVRRALAAEDLGRSLILPPDALGPRPTTDGGHFHGVGVPLVNFLTAPMYLFDSRDTMDKIHEASIEPVTRAAIRILADTAGRTAAEARPASP